MLFQRINRSHPEKVFISVYNSYGTAPLSNGQVVSWDYVTDGDGVSVTKPAAGPGIGCAGVVTQTINAGDYGLVQVYGYHSAVRARILSGGPDIAKGSPLVMSAAVFAFESMATASTTAATVKFPSAFALAAYTIYTTSTVAAFIKAL